MKVRTKRKNKRLKMLELENKKYQEIVENLQNKIKYDDYLKEENRKLIDWVQKILKEFGTCEVGERKIQIPIMKHKDFIHGNTDDYCFLPPSEYKVNNIHIG